MFNFYFTSKEMQTEARSEMKTQMASKYIVKYQNIVYKIAFVTFKYLNNVAQ